MTQALADMIREYIKLSDQLLLESVRMGWTSTRAAKDEALRLEVWQVRLDRLEAEKPDVA